MHRSKQMIFTNRFSIDSSASVMIDSNEPPVNNNSYNNTSTTTLTAVSTTQSLNRMGHQSPSRPSHLNHSISLQSSTSNNINNYQASQPHYNTANNNNNSNHQISNSISTTTLTTNSSSVSRHSWMNDSDMEVDEELPSLSANIDKQQFEQLTKKEIKLQEIINELIHTEQKHVRNLKIMQNHFYIPIKCDMLLTEDERNLLFPNLEEILELHC